MNKRNTHLIDYSSCSIIELQISICIVYFLMQSFYVCKSKTIGIKITIKSLASLHFYNPLHHKLSLINLSTTRWLCRINEKIYISKQRYDAGIKNLSKKKLNCKFI